MGIAKRRLTISLSACRFQVGDQILRVNGYPVEDAVHQEVALLAKNQQVLVLKIRSNYLASILIIFVAKYNTANVNFHSTRRVEIYSLGRKNN